MRATLRDLAEEDYIDIANLIRLRAAGAILGQMLDGGNADDERKIYKIKAELWNFEADLADRVKRE